MVEEGTRGELILRLHGNACQRDNDLRPVSVDDDGLAVDGADEADHLRVRDRADEKSDSDENACDSIHFSCAVLTHDGHLRGIDAHSVWRGGR